MASGDKNKKIVASDGANDDEFGVGVDIDGDYLIVGARLENASGSEAGSAYIFKNISGTWTEEAKIGASDGSSTDQFGRYVAISGDVAVATAYRGVGSQNDYGAAYVFRSGSSGWYQEQKITPDFLVGNDDYYGVSVAFDGEHIAIGSQRHDDNPAGSNRGAVYIYQSASSDAGTGWYLQQK